MPSPRILFAAVAAMLAWVLSTGCVPVNSLPGTALGTFAVTAVLSSNSCGTGLNLANPRKFDAELSLDDNTLYFKPTDEAVVSAPLDSDDSATFTSVDNSPSTNDSSCSLSLKTIYTVKLDSASAPTTAAGSLRFEYSALRSNSCASQLSSKGGVYDELPCSAEFSYTALKK